VHGNRLRADLVMSSPLRDNQLAQTERTQRQKRRRFASFEAFEMPDDFAFAMLGFTTMMALASILAAIFATMLSLPDFWRYVSSGYVLLALACLLPGLLSFSNGNKKPEGN
jgi:hypothetical protein